jgi:hypothetical protein
MTSGGPQGPTFHLCNGYQSLGIFQMVLMHVFPLLRLEDKQESKVRQGSQAGQGKATFSSKSQCAKQPPSHSPSQFSDGVVGILR